MAVFVATTPAFAESPKHNTLTPQEIAAGWILLFDGETTFGWKTEGDVVVEKRGNGDWWNQCVVRVYIYSFPLLQAQVRVSACLGRRDRGNGRGTIVELLELVPSARRQFGFFRRLDRE